MQKTKLIVAVLGALSAMPVLAADAPAPAFTPSANVAIVSNYLYRGISQTGAKPALQGGFDLAHASGAYAGVWGSSISWISDAGTGVTNAGTEFDTYLGYKGEAAGLGYDVGVLRYNYPGTYGANLSADTNEVYGAITYSIVTAKYSYSTSDLFGVADSKGSTYAELNASYTIPDTAYSLGAHYGTQKIANSSTYDYSDYKLSVSADFSGYVVGLAYSSTNADEALWTVGSNNLGKSATVLSLSRAM